MCGAQEGTHRSWSWRGWRRLSRGDFLDHPMHHRAPFSEVANVIIDGDAGVPAAVPAVGAEAAGEATVAQDDDAFADVARPNGPPHDGVQVRLVVVALDRAEAGRRLHGGREREVPAVGGAAEEHVVEVAALDQVHPPRRVQGGAARAEGDADPVLVGVEVQAAHQAPHPHVDPVRELIHRGRRWWRCAAASGAPSALLRGGEEEEGAEQGRCSLRRFRLGAEAARRKVSRRGQVGCCRDVPPVQSDDRWARVWALERSSGPSIFLNKCAGEKKI